MKHLGLLVLLATMVGCAGLPKFDVTTPDGKNYAHTDNKVSFNQDGHQVSCVKEADTWDCTYTDDKGLIVKLQDIDVVALEKELGAE